MIRTWLVRLTAVLLLAVQAQPLAAALLCEARMPERDSCGQPMRSDTASVGGSQSDMAHGTDCFRMGPCATAAQWTAPAGSGAILLQREATVPAPDVSEAPPSFNAAPATPPPQA